MEFSATYPSGGRGGMAETATPPYRHYFSMAVSILLPIIKIYFNSTTGGVVYFIATEDKEVIIFNYLGKSLSWRIGKLVIFCYHSAFGGKDA